MQLYKTNGVLRLRYIFVLRMLRVVGIWRRVTKQQEVVSMVILAKKTLTTKNGINSLAANVRRCVLNGEINVYLYVCNVCTLIPRFRTFINLRMKQMFICQIGQRYNDSKK